MNAPAAARRGELLTPAVLLLIAAALASAAVLATLQSHISFFLDEWDLLLHRRGFDADAFLRPHNEHIILGPAIVYKAIQATLGMDSPAPYQAISIAMFVASAVLLFVWVRRRIGEWWALLAALLILFLGAAWEDLLSAFQIGYFGSMTFGLAALLALERPGPGRNVLACAALVIACSFSSVGLTFLVGAAIAIATSPRGRRGVWIVAVPAALFAIWWIGWGSEADTSITFDSVARTPEYVLSGLASGVSALLGLAPSSGTLEQSGLDWGRPLILAVGAVAVWRAYAVRGGSRWLWVAVAMLLTFWVLAAINAALFRPPFAPRYTYIGAIFTLMVAAELLRGRRLPRWSLCAAFAIAAIAIAANTVNLRDGYRTFKGASANGRAGITAIELARDTVAPDFLLTERNSNAPFFDYVDAESYLSAVDAFGSPGYSEAELQGAEQPVRVAADEALAAAEELELVPTGEPCPTPGLKEGERVVGPGTVRITAGPGAVRVRLRRFATGEYPVDLGRLGPDRSATLTIPDDRATTPWRLQLSGLEVCPTS